MNTEKIFIGKLNTIQTQFGEIITIGLSPKDKETINQYSNNQGWCNLKLMTSLKGHKYIEIDTYALNKDKVYQSNSDDVAPAKIQQEDDDINLEEIPF
jgi:hypothetical protein